MGVEEPPSDVDEGVAADEEYEGDELSDKRAAAETSVGIMMGLLARGDKSTVPSSLIVSGFMEKNDRANKMFSAAYDCDHGGRLLRSMLPPQAAAEAWPDVTFCAYDMPA